MHVRAQSEIQGSTPSRRRPLVGRDSEIAELAKSVTSNALTTVTGPGGVGKTAIPLAVAATSEAQFPDGVFVVWLASLRSTEHISGELAAQVGMPRSGGQSYEDALAEWLADRDVMLVLDNCEHVVSAVADLIDGLTARLPRLRVLATSREPLRVVDELSYRLAPLPVADREATRAKIDASPAIRRSTPSARWSRVRSARGRTTSTTRCTWTGSPRRWHRSRDCCGPGPVRRRAPVGRLRAGVDSRSPHQLHGESPAQTPHSARPTRGDLRTVRDRFDRRRPPEP